MFESAELGHKIDKATYDKELPALREALLDAQFELAQTRKFPVIIIIAGVDGAGKGEIVNLLHEWMDPRHIQTHATRDPTDEERDRPEMWRFWRDLPPNGKIGIFFGSWYTWPMLERVYGKTKNADLDQSLATIVRFERMLTDDGALIIKLRLHLSKQREKQRLQELAGDSKMRWRVTQAEWDNYKRYDTFQKVATRTLRLTSTAEAPWIIVEGADERYRSMTVGKIVLEALRRRLARKEATKNGATMPLLRPADQLHVLQSLDLSQKVPRKAYQTALTKLQGKLNQLTRHPHFSRLPVIIVFEGSDAAGKGGSIRRITGALDARQYRIIPIAAPTDEERAHPYLWRFWRHIQRPGRVTIFDRSWYGRVLVERVEGFCSEASWMRAYGEINDFEEQLTRNNTVLVKFWLAIDKDEQLRRFKEREAIGFKRFKITEEDWRNRKKWAAYERAVGDMVDRTSTELAPWTLVEANEKYFARLKVLETLCQQIERKM
jgi:AMP-polyphosphate phosphotransferase